MVITFCHPAIGFKIKILDYVVGRRRITSLRPPLSGLVKTVILKPIVYREITANHGDFGGDML